MVSPASARSLYRDTDPIGSWVLDGVTRPDAEVDRFLVDPATLAAPIRGHVDYWVDAAYEPTVVALLEGQRAGAEPPASSGAERTS